MSASLKMPERSSNLVYEEVAFKAERLARHGLIVFPCGEDKRPTCKWGELATRHPEDVLILWRTYPGPLIGVVTGSASGFDVVYLDWGKGGDDWYAEHCTRVPATRTHRTRSGGLHLLLRHREGTRNSASRIAPGVDVRGNGGFIIWWPATGLPIVDRSPAAPWPAWLAGMALPPPPPVADLRKVENGLRDAGRYMQGAVRAAVSAVASAPEGARNATLNGETFGLAKYIASGHLTAGQIAEAMAAAGLQAGLAKLEIEATIRSALRAAMAG
ncbi:bifunctional DNA primase/polymerase [Acetobacter estunensis]|uniref:bifunctional DNA primase/polymerase n=1 Tax=Acetobacter estunensis TaxID=104097 RepID=UPI001C2D51BA|nr:bifunctional DNA primase/polymerase [Acetobacter estunensis]MBV1837175.1 bifunctional DNA primase/polymerase [Acetobacter estunensis]